MLDYRKKQQCLRNFMQERLLWEYAEDCREEYKTFPRKKSSCFFDYFFHDKLSHYYKHVRPNIIIDNSGNVREKTDVEIQEEIESSEQRMLERIEEGRRWEAFNVLDSLRKTLEEPHLEELHSVRDKIEEVLFSIRERSEEGR